MDNRILWDIIDGLRDEVNVAQDGITDLNDEVKRLKEEHDYNIELTDDEIHNVQ